MVKPLAVDWDLNNTSLYFNYTTPATRTIRLLAI